jgi:transposase InsO family protein
VEADLPQTDLPLRTARQRTARGHRAGDRTESGGRRLRLLSAYIFQDLDQVRQISANWIRDYNDERPHEALGSLPPAPFRAMIQAKPTSTSKLSA